MADHGAIFFYSPLVDGLWQTLADFEAYSPPKSAKVCLTKNGISRRTLADYLSLLWTGVNPLESARIFVAHINSIASQNGNVLKLSYIMEICFGIII